MHSSFFEKAAKPTFLTRIDIHRHYGKTIQSAYVCFSFDISLNIEISIQQKTNLISGNFEGQTTKNYLRLNLLGYLIFWEGCLISFKELL